MAGIIRDIHSDGARIRTIDSYPVPVTEAILEMGGRLHRGRVVWRQDRDMGLDFTARSHSNEAQVAALRDTLMALRQAAQPKP